MGEDENKLETLRLHLEKKGPFYTGFILSPTRGEIKPFSTNAPSRYLDDLNNSGIGSYRNALDDFGIVYCEEFPFGKETAQFRLKELQTLTEEEVQSLLDLYNPKREIQKWV
jgi:hypothetical protein